MSERTAQLALNTPVKATQMSLKIVEDARGGTRPGSAWFLSLERARLLTESYKETEGEPMILRRAKGIAHVLENMTIYISPGELIVGNFSATPDTLIHYPEFAYRWVERETEKGAAYENMLNDEGRKELKEIDSYWHNYAVHSIYRNYIPEDLADVMQIFLWECGTPNYEKILRIGLKGYLKEAGERRKRLDKEYTEEVIGAADYVEKRLFLDSVIIALNATINYARRYARLAREMAQSEADPIRKHELEVIAENCGWVPENPARTLHEAIQSYWFIHLIVGFIELPMVGDGIRFDVCMGPFYEKDLEEGRITREAAQELVECVFIKGQETGYLQPAIGAAATEGNVGFQTLNIGGVDSVGDDVSNEMSPIVLDAMKSVRTVTPPLALRWHDKMPKKLIDKAIECLASGMPQPAIFNDKVNIPRLVSLGVPIEEARNYSINNCMVPTIPGKNLNHRSAWAGGVSLPACLCSALGIEPLAGFFKTGNAMAEPEKISSIEELMDATAENCKWYMKRITLVNNIADKLYEEYVPRPFLSAVLDDSIERAEDIRKWNHKPDYRDIVLFGLNNAADSLAAIKKLVFDEKKVSMAELIEALKNDWDGYEDLRQMCLDAPKFGNDDDYVDLISRELGRRVAKVAKECKTYHGAPLTTDGTVATGFWMIGFLTPATPDGRRNSESLHDGSVSPMVGRDHKGPTAVLKSVSKVDPLVTWNHLFNQTFLPQYLVDHNAELFAQYLKTFADLGIHHVQFSIVDRETLIDAQKHPEKHTDVMVRVCGYSAYFIDLAKDLQDQIIARTSQCF